MSGNSNLHDSARNKQDEFYTELSMIEKELKHYKKHFENKVVLCNCIFFIVMLFSYKKFSFILKKRTYGKLCL